MNIINLLSTSTIKFKNNSVIKIGHIDMFRDILIKKLSYYQTGVSEIDSLERDKREFVSDTILVKLKKEMRQVNKKSDVLLKDADAILKNIISDISKEINDYKFEKQKPENYF
jgi:hypothetical protein